jgi:hypothetical protein
MPMHILYMKNTDMQAALKAAAVLQKCIDDGCPKTDDEADAKKGDELEVIFEQAMQAEGLRRPCDPESHSDCCRLQRPMAQAWQAGDQRLLCVPWRRKTVAAQLGHRSQSLGSFNLHATGQRWYCKLCCCNYFPRYGVLVEIILGTTACYCKASLPPCDLQHANVMRIDEDYKQYTTPEALLEALPNIKPPARGDFFKETTESGHYKFDADMMAGLEEMRWSQLYNLDAPPP